MTAMLDLPIPELYAPRVPPRPVPPRVPPRPVPPSALAPSVPPVRTPAPVPTSAPAHTPAPVRTPSPVRARVRPLAPRGAVAGFTAAPAAWGVAAARPMPAALRLTRRARLLVTSLTVAGAVGLVGLAAAQAEPGTGGLDNAPASVVVQPGDTLWQIAVDVAPGERPAWVVELLQEANGLDGTAVQPGQVLSIPRG